MSKPENRNLSTQKTWISRKDTIQQTPKFLRKGSLVTVMPEPAPTTKEVDGKYGKRTMNVVMTEEYGLIYVSDLQLSDIVTQFRNQNLGETWKPVKVNL